MSWPAEWSSNEGNWHLDEEHFQKSGLQNGKMIEKDKEPLLTTISEKVAVLRSVGEECVTESELEKLLEKKETCFRLYDGFEPSGRMHIAQGVFKAMNVNKCTACGGTFVFWVADWFALMNDKMGGDLEKIKQVGKYLVEVWKAAGMVMDKVEFRWASEEITKKANEYWPLVLDVARRFTLARLIKCCTALGRSEGNLSAAQILYPLMQCTDIFFLKADICQLGVDQRKVNMLARDYCDAAGIKFKPIILSHHMLYGLKEGQAKMSKSDPDSAIFMEDSASEVERKILQAYCPREKNNNISTISNLRLIQDDLANPCLDYVRHIVFAPLRSPTFQAPDGKLYTSADQVENAFLMGELSENDLKRGLIDALNALLNPVRQHFENDPSARALVERVRSYKRTNNNNTPTKTKSFSVSSLEERRQALIRALAKGGDTIHNGFFKTSNARLDFNKPIRAVFAPPPKAAPCLQEALSLVEALHSSEYQCILVLADWSAIALDACSGEAKARDAAASLLAVVVTKLSAFFKFPIFGVVRQSDYILERPSSYWIDVINAGRALRLDDVVKATKQSAEPRTGPVVAALLRSADLAATCASSSPIDPINELAATLVSQVSFDTLKPTLNTRLQPLLTADEIANGLQDDSEDRDFFIFTDDKAAVKRKIKRAFCAPGDISFNPPLAYCEFLLTKNLVSTIAVKRPPENGGDKDYTDFAQLRADFASTALHPGDLKPALTIALQNTLFDVITSAIQAPGDKTAKTAHAAIKAMLKKIAKSKK
mmetsp:Transcript_2648/g.4225  ORF Transcript_2648/g.4225 Transcript_2648/m.4225 type:complete len:771 (-) Transcript_2648:1220-3532(-)